MVVEIISQIIPTNYSPPSHSLCSISIVLFRKTASKCQAEFSLIFISFILSFPFLCFSIFVRFATGFSFNPSESLIIFFLLLDDGENVLFFFFVRCPLFAVRCVALENHLGSIKGKEQNYKMVSQGLFTLLILIFWSLDSVILLPVKLTTDVISAHFHKKDESFFLPSSEFRNVLE